MVVMDYIIVICAIMVVSIACSMTKKGFSTGIFMASVSTGIAVLVWSGSLPFYSLILAFTVIVMMLFRGGNEGAMDE